ncbi:MAG: hypothetical protein HKN35_09100, partial [Woeseia sp.]|nr:hypothetical protein [Woeseia sp.]
TFSSDLEVAERGFGKAVLVLQRSGAATGAVSVDYSLTAGNATEGDDYSGATSGTVNWADGDADPKSLEFIINDDGINEDAEFFELTFSNPTGAVLSGTATSRITILNGTGVNLAPNAVVASGIVAAENSRVTLNGAQSNDPDGDTLAYEWSQTSGPAVILSTPATVTTEFTAPEVTSDTLLQFRLTVSDPAGLTDSATANVTVTNGNPPANSGSGGGGGAPAGLFVASVLLFVLRRAVIRKDLA